MIILKTLLLLVSFSTAFCQDTPLSVVIVGGGPAGLATAIEANTAGADVTIIEKREYHSRDRFLFLLEPSLKLLTQWGVTVPELTVFQGAEAFGFSNIKNLEIGLAEKVNALGITKIVGEFQKFGDNTVIISQQDREIELSYDLLVGADGAHSAVRDHLHIASTLYGNSFGSVTILPFPKNDSLDYILPFKSGSIFINKIVLPIGTLILSQANELSKEALSTELMNCGWHEEAASILSESAKYVDSIEIVLQQSVSFSDNKKSAIILGDAAASASFLRGKGANYALEGARAAGLFFRTKQNEADYAEFNSAMQEITDRLVNDSAFLFDIPPPKER